MVNLFIMLIVFLVLLYIVWLIVNQLGLPPPIPMITILVFFMLGLYFILQRAGVVAF